MDYRHQPLGLRFTKTRAVAQGQIAEAKADTVADLAQIVELFAIADGDLHRVAAAGAEIAVKELRSDPVFHRLDQRMLQVVPGMVLQADEFRTKPLQAEWPAADGRIVGMRQHAAVAGQAERQPVVRTMQRDGETLGVSDIDTADAGEEGP